MRNELPLIPRPGPRAGMQSTRPDLVWVAAAGFWLLCVGMVAVVTVAHSRGSTHIHLCSRYKCLKKMVFETLKSHRPGLPGKAKTSHPMGRFQLRFVCFHY